MRHRILVTDDEELIRWSLKSSLEDAGYEVVETDSGEAALDVVRSEDIALVLLDIVMPGKDGFSILQEMKKIDGGVPVIMITAFGSIESAVKCIRAGAYDYITKPFILEEVVLKVQRALQARGLTKQLNKFQAIQTNQLLKVDVVCVSRMMQGVMEKIAKLNEAEVDVILITGETGTGKGLLAKRIHGTGRNSKGPFVSVNCAAIPDTLLESELFGYEKGAFTDAKQGKEGLAEQAQGGSLFMDEIGELSYRLQSKILRFIEERSMRRLGGSKEIELNFRLISATNRDLQKAMQLGEFRSDLYHRLNLINIHVPPLRERRDDILPLAEFFLERFRRKYNKEIVKFTEKACQVLLDYCWPGNVRELANIVERCCILENSSAIDYAQISDYLLITPTSLSNPHPEVELDGNNLSFEAMLSHYKLHILKSALDKCGQNKAQAAKLLQMDRATFRYQLKMTGIE